MTSNILHCLDFRAQMGWPIDLTERLVMICQPQQQPIAIAFAEEILLVPNFANDLQLQMGQLFDWLKVC